MAEPTVALAELRALLDDPTRRDITLLTTIIDTTATAIIDLFVQSYREHNRLPNPTTLRVAVRAAVKI
jgi:hypothetical protein